MKSLALLNPRRRRKHKKSAARKHRRTTRRTRRTRRASAPRITVRRRSRSSALVMANPRRRKARRVARRSTARRSGGFRGGRGLLGQITGVFNRETLVTVGGGVAAAVVIAQVTERYGDKLPLYHKKDASGNSTGELNPMGIVLYDLALPIAGAMLTRRFSPALARGMIFGGLYKAVVDGLAQYAGPTYATLFHPGAAATAEYLQPSLPAAGVGAFAPSYQGSTQFRAIRPVNGALDNNSAFRSSGF